MLEGETSDLWQIIYNEYDKIPIKPTFVNTKSHIDATQAIFRKASIRHILANEAADAAVEQATDEFSSIVQELRAVNKSDQQVFD